MFRRGKIIFALFVFFQIVNNFSVSAQVVLKSGIDYPAEIENPELLGINKEPYHATLMPYANLQEALVAKRHASSLCRSLRC